MKQEQWQPGQREGGERHIACHFGWSAGRRSLSRGRGLAVDSVESRSAVGSAAQRFESLLTPSPRVVDYPPSTHSAGRNVNLVALATIRQARRAVSALCPKLLLRCTRVASYT